MPTHHLQNDDFNRIYANIVLANIVILCIVFDICMYFVRYTPLSAQRPEREVWSLFDHLMCRHLNLKLIHVCMCRVQLGPGRFRYQLSEFD